MRCVWAAGVDCLWLPGDLRSDCLYVHCPGLRRVAPDLPFRQQFSPLLRGPGAYVVHLWINGGACIDMRPALRAECLRALVAAFRRLDVDPGLPAQQLEVLFCGGSHCPESRAREYLAIHAVADADRSGIDLGRIGNEAAMAAAVDAHENLPEVCPKKPELIS